MDSYAGNVDLPARWAPPNMTNAANTAYDSISNLGNFNTASQVLPGVYNSMNAGTNNPFRTFAQQTANTGADLGITTGKQNLAAAQPFMNATNSVVPFATQMLN